MKEDCEFLLMIKLEKTLTKQYQEDINVILNIEYFSQENMPVITKIKVKLNDS